MPLDKRGPCERGAKEGHSP